MRGGGNKAPPRPIYRPGSGPLRKSRGDDFEPSEGNSSKPTSVQDRLKPIHFNNYNNSNSPGPRRPGQQRPHMNQNWDEIFSNDGRNNQGSQGGSSKSNHMSYMESRKKNKKPEQPLYAAPKRGKDAPVEKEAPNNNFFSRPYVQNANENDGPSVSGRDYSDSHSGQRGGMPRGGGNSYPSKNCPNNFSNNQPKCFMNNRRGQPDGNERWRTESPVYGEHQREVRQGSVPSGAKNMDDMNRSRDTRSVDSFEDNDKFQGKPPMGKRGGRDMNMPKRNNREKLDNLPPRFRKLQERKLMETNNQTPDDSWDGSTVTFQGHNLSYRPPVRNRQPHQHSDDYQPQWSNTVPGRSKNNRGPRLKHKDHRSDFWLVNHDLRSRSTSRSHSPIQDNIHRPSDNPDSGNAMYTSNDSVLMPPPPPSYNYSRNSCTSPVDYQKKNISQTPNIVQEKSEASSPVEDKDDGTEVTLDWYEEVELCERLEAEQLSRSSSVMSSYDNTGACPTNNQPFRVRRNSHKKKKSRRQGRDRSNPRDKPMQQQDPRHDSRINQFNRDDNSKGQHLAGNSVGNINRRFDNRRRNGAHHSRDSSRETKYPGINRQDDYHRNRPSQFMEENWRSKPSGESSSGSKSHYMPPPSHANSQPPGMLVLPEQGPPMTNVSPRMQNSNQPQRILFDPNNPNRPIKVPMENRVFSQYRGHDMPVHMPPGQCYPYHNVPPQNHPYGDQNPHMGSVNVQYPTDQYGSNVPSWYGHYPESLRSSSNDQRLLLLDIERHDLELQSILARKELIKDWNKICDLRRLHQESLKTLLEQDLRFCESENVEQHFWKIAFYNIIEILRESMATENNDQREGYKKIMLNLIEEGTAFFLSLLTLLETKYNFKLDTFLTPLAGPKGMGMEGLALVSAQKILLFLGDFARYKEQVNGTVNYGKSRQWYLKAQQINPKNGRPYSQLALLAHYARRKLDAVYYYMRSLMASNPFHSSRESLIAMFDENRRKYESTERKRREEREWKERERMKEKESSTLAGGGLRREIWIHPSDGKKMRRTTSAASDPKLTNSDAEDISELPTLDLNKRFITSYLHIHGKLITKIGMEAFQEAAIQMLREFRALLNASPLPLPGTRLLQLLALNMFAIESTQLKGAEIEQGVYRSEVSERALIVSLQMFSLILERALVLLQNQTKSSEQPRLIVDKDMQILLPAIKVWCDWMLCHSPIWNPPPSCADYKVGPSGDPWSRLASMVNLLEKLDYPRDLLISADEVDRHTEELKLIRLPEDTMMAGFTPLMLNPEASFYVDKKEDMEVVQVILRIKKILFLGQVFLCGLETPVLKLQKNENGDDEWVSVVETFNNSTPDSPPEHSDSEIVVDSYSEDEGEDDSAKIKRSSAILESGDGDQGMMAAGEIRSLIERKEELERKQRRQERHRQRVQAILQKSSLQVEIEVRPKQLVPDTNCFIDFLPQLQSIIKATSSAQPIYTLMIPLVVLSELEGLSKGANIGDMSGSKAKTNPQHLARVAENAKIGLNFARSKNPAIKSVTTKGTILTSSSFTTEEDPSQFQEELISNDDKILATCLSLCKFQKDQYVNEAGKTRRLKREVVLLTDDRNLRVKALGRDVPVREMPDFIQWAGLG